MNKQLLSADEIKFKHYKTAAKLIQDELDLALKKHPYWPIDILHGLAVIQEELGEAFQAALDIAYFPDKNNWNLQTELAQVGCTVIRMLAYLKRTNDE